jgi:hypothetical protein
MFFPSVLNFAVALPLATLTTAKPITVAASSREILDFAIQTIAAVLAAEALATATPTTAAAGLPEIQSSVLPTIVAPWLPRMHHFAILTIAAELFCTNPPFAIQNKKGAS